MGIYELRKYAKASLCLKEGENIKTITEFIEANED